MPAALMILTLAAGAPHAHADPASKGPRKVPLEEIGLPHYAPPASFREDLVVTNAGKTMTMKRFVDHERIRTEMASDGQDFVMIEAGDPEGTTYMLMPGEKRAMKQSRAALEKIAPGLAKAKEAGGKNEKAGEAPPDVTAEDLGEETIDGTRARKLRMSYEGDGNVLGWFDKTTGAPLRMETDVDGKKSVIEWKNRDTKPQSEKLFVVPKGYEVTDMDEMMAKMGGMGATGNLGGLMGGMGGMGAGAMAKGMAGNMVQGMGSNLGGSLGATLGGSLGGPLGSIAGRFIGGKIGGMLGKKAANAIN